MPTLTRPGVYVDESAFPTYVAATPGAAAAAFVGICPRGPLTPTVVNSWRDFTTQYGSFDPSNNPSPLHLAVYSYFSAGGTSAVVIRVVALASSPPVAAMSVFEDSGASAQPTLEVHALSGGLWGDNIYIDITPGTLTTPPSQTQSQSVAQSFTLTVKYKGTDPASVVETWSNISMDENSSYQGQGNYALSIINSPYSGSNYITLVDRQSTNLVPSNNPAAVTGAQLTGGLDGSNPQSPPA